MNSLAVALILVSAVVHAIWNLAARRRQSEVTFFARALGCVAVFASPLIVLEIATGGEIVRPALRYILMSGVCIGVYFYALARAYRASDFTVVYPVARAVPILIVAVADVMLGRVVTRLAVVGMGLIVLGCIFTPLRTFRAFKVTHYLNRGTVWIALAIAGTVGFTLSDKAATAITGGGFAAFRYLYFPYLICFFVFAALAALFGRDEAPDATSSWRWPALASMMTYGGYGLVVWAFSLCPQASYVVAFRQVSIIIGVVLAFVVYHEKGRWPRLTGATLMVAGLLLVALKGDPAG